MLSKQLKRYIKGIDGKPIKVNDHGPDALMCALLHFIYLDEFPIEQQEEEKPEQNYLF